MMKAELIGDDKLVAYFQQMPKRLEEELTTTLKFIVVTLVRYIQENKLSGQVLKRRTGTLSRSIKGFVENEKGRVSGTVWSRDNGNAPLAYAAYHEYGFTGEESVRAHVRKTASGGLANVREHIRRVNYPAHSFMRTSLVENRAFIDQQFNQAVNKATSE